MSLSIGRRTWAIPEGYIPSGSNGPAPQMVSHEAVCILNASDQAAKVKITVFFEDREPAGPYPIDLGARRTKHVRLDELNNPEPIPKDTNYSMIVESDTPVIVQHSRLDSRQAENALMTTIAFPADA